MKLTKTEKAAILLTALFLVFTFGVHWGVGRVRDSFTISTQTEASARQIASDAAVREAPENDTAADTARGTAQDSAADTVRETSQDGTAAQDSKININTAEADELMRLKGIGEKLAARIIADREENGAFARIEDITRVSGIGEVTYMNICEEITVE